MTTPTEPEIPRDTAWLGREPGQADVDALIERIRSNTEDPIDAVVAERRLGEALVYEVQGYLSDTSTDDDVDLFFETHGRVPADPRGWPLAILNDLARHGLDGAGVAPIVQRALDRAKSLRN